MSDAACCELSKTCLCQRIINGGVYALRQQLDKAAADGDRLKCTDSLE